VSTVAEVIAHIEAERQQKAARREQSTERKLKRFYSSRAWRAARFRALRDHGYRCFYCGATPGDGTTKIVIDHRLPLRHFYHLRLSPENLVPACQKCNLGKGSTVDEGDKIAATENPTGAVLAEEVEGMPRSPKGERRPADSGLKYHLRPEQS
jgi:5-methylcytosine-specific restriction endonuclease McrA